jgi:hypothetical protein
VEFGAHVWLEGHELLCLPHGRVACDTGSFGGKVSARVLEQFYAELRRCRTRCDGRFAIDHREDGPHECRVVRHKRRPGRPPAGGYPEHDCEKVGCVITVCPPHTCRPLSNATISKLHFIIRGALSAAVRWDWISSNPAIVAKKPRQPGTGTSAKTADA